MKPAVSFSFLFLFVALPLFSAFIIGLLGRRIRNLGDVVTVSTGVILFALSSFALPLVLSRGLISCKSGSWPFPLGISFVADGLSMFMLFTVNTVCALVLVYSLSYMVKYTDKWNYQALFMLMIAGLNGVILSSDIFNLYVFLEVASLSGYVLVAFSTEPEALESSFRYAVMGALASVFILLGIGLLYAHTSTLNMADIASVLASKPRGLLIDFISVLFIAGFGLKAALIPFHSWLPDAHSSAPSPVSAALSGVVIKTLGVYALLRVFFNVLGPSQNLLYVLMFLGLLSMTAGSFLAVAQTDIKRMFAYSSISQVGYIIFAFGLATPLGVIAGIFHLFNHAVFKSLLFLDAGSIEHATCSRDLRELKGLSQRMPVTAATSLVGSMSISGVPPFSGFWSKLLIIIAAIEAGHPVFALVAALMSVITLIYYLNFQSGVFFGGLQEKFMQVKEVPLTMKISMVILALICASGGLLLLPQLRPFLQSAADVLTSASNYKEMLSSALQ